MEKRIGETGPQIVAGGGWTKRETIGRPKARICGFLSIIWLLVFVPACILLWAFWSGPPSSWWLKWLCGILLIPQPVFMVLAFLFRLFEQPRSITITERAKPADWRVLKATATGNRPQ